MNLNEELLKSFLDEIKERNFKSIYFLCSGGFDSTYMLLKLYNQFPNCKKYILYNNTTIEIENCKNLVYLLSFLTNIQLIELKPNCEVKEILETSFLAIKEAKKLYDNHCYHKKVFNCCYYLKIQPMKLYLKKILLENSNQMIFLSGIKKNDSKNRRIFLFQLTKKETFIHFNKSKKIWMGYPLRDISQIKIDNFIKKFPFKVSHSGCLICPILLLFNLFKQEPKRYIQSKKYYLKITNNNPCISLNNQTLLNL